MHAKLLIKTGLQEATTYARTARKGRNSRKRVSSWRPASALGLSRGTMYRRYYISALLCTSARYPHVQN